MAWETAALMAAAGFALKGFSSKAACRAGADELGLMVWITIASTVGLGVARLIGSAPVAISNPIAFARLLLLILVLATLANVCYFTAIRLAPLSVVMPVLGLSPAFSIFTSRWLIGESADAAGVVGVLGIAAGIAILYGGVRSGEVDAREYRRGFFFALATAAIWSVTSNLDKVAVRMADPILYPFIHHLTLIPVYFILVPRLRPGAVTRTMRTPEIWKWVALAALMDVVVLTSQMTAILQTHVAYVTAVKRSGAILAVLMGWLFFKEKQILRRGLACALIVAGVAVLLLLHPSAQP